ncbi:hypothetical protein FACS189434_10620 [Bacteroidia bacterium]|nr:hypothetical protein FACS189434_10620 [Bacteroidia bacterium]
MEKESEKTMRPETAVEKTMRPAADAEKTMRPDAAVEKTMRPNADKTMRPEQQEEISQIVNRRETEFVLNKVKYQVVKIISQGTGEAEIYLVENGSRQYALKLYYVGIVPPPDHNIMEIVKKSAGAGLLVDTLDHGVWTNPQTQEQRDYELMEYCSGGSLDQIKISHDAAGEKLLSEIALKCAASLDFLHKKQVIHRDVKPANFFFKKTGNDVADLALADFGIAIVTDKNGTANIDYQLRTKIYAAPEYYYSIDGKIQIGTKSDFYSLGMMLLTIWNGEEIFKINEFELINLKRNGNLPYPKDLSDRTLQLIKALTVADPNTRAALPEIIRWANGETIYTDKDDSRKFKIVFNASKGQVAHSPEELAQLMYDERDLSVKYLYSGKIAQWLSENLRPELAQQIDDTTETLYPKDQSAGLLYTCYTLNPEIPYHDIAGNALTGSEEIAQTLKDNFKHYEQALAKANDTLFLFFDTHGAGNVTRKFAPLFKKTGDNRNVLLQLIYALNPALPWIVTTDDKEAITCQTIDEVLQAKYDYTWSDESWEDLIQESFLVWVGTRDKSLEGKIRSQQGHDKNQFCVLYSLNPKVSYTLQLDEKNDNYLFTVKDLAWYMNWMMERYIKDENDNDASGQLDNLCDINDSRLYYYLKSKGKKYEDFIPWIKYCGDLQSEDNSKKAGPYNWRIGVYKAIKGMGYDPYYYFPKCNKTACTLEELSQIPVAEIKEEMKNDYFQAWLTLFYQENPDLDLKPKYAYEKETVKYVEHLEKIDAKNPEVQNYYAAKKSVESKLATLKRKRKTAFWTQIVFGTLTFLAAVFVIFKLVTFSMPAESDMYKSVANVAAWIVGIAGFILLWISGEMGWLINLLIAGVAAVIVYLLFAFLAPYCLYLVAAGILAAIVYAAYKVFNGHIGDYITKSQLYEPGFEERNLEPLHFAFRSNRQNFQSSIGDETDKAITYYKWDLQDFFKGLILPWSLLLVFGAVVLFALPAFEEDAAEEAAAQKQYNTLIGDWNGTFDGKNATLKIEDASSKKVNATIYVKYNTLLQEGIRGNIDLGDKTFHFDDRVTNGNLDGEYNGRFNDDLSGFSGIYQNYKTKKQVPFVFAKKAAVTIVAGTWYLTGQDSKKWTGKLIVESVNKNSFKGYIEWYNNSKYYTNFSGREYYDGTYDSGTKQVTLNGTRLEDATGLTLGVYVAILSEDGKELTDGNWSGGGTWKAVLKN